MEKQLEAIADLPQAQQQRIPNVVQVLIAQVTTFKRGSAILSRLKEK